MTDFDIKDYISINKLKKYESFVTTFFKKERSIIAEYSIPKHEYDFITKRSGKYYVVDKENRRATLFIKKKYYSEVLEKYFSNPMSFVEQPVLTSTSVEQPVLTSTSVEQPVLTSTSVVQDKLIPKITKKEKIPATQTKKILSQKILPRIILKEEEKMKIGDTIYDLDLRGERNAKQIFVSVSSVGQMFGIANLVADVRKKKEDVDYVKLTIERQVNGKPKKFARLYFSYFQFIKYSYKSRSPIAAELVEQFTHILYTHQLGTNEQKKVLASSLLGNSIIDVKKVLKMSSTPLSCVYLLALGTVKTLRTIMNIDSKYSDDMIVCKYGRTKDLGSRLTQHSLAFKKLKIENISVKYYSHVDTSSCSKAELFIREYIKDLNIEFFFGSLTELAIMPMNIFKVSMKKRFSEAEKLFCIENKQLLDKIKEIENKHAIEILENKMNFMKISNEKSLLESQLKIKEYELKIQKYEMENQIRQLKDKISSGTSNSSK